MRSGEEAAGPDMASDEAERRLRPTLEDKVAFLRRPESYPEKPLKVEPRETHMSWVFLTDAHAYKLKKPVRTDFLDFSTLEARRRDCEAELRLNRRLAPDVYLGAVALTMSPDGILGLGGEGEIVDWLVRMRRLPPARMLDRLIADGSLLDEEIHAIGTCLGRFYLDLPPADLTAHDYLTRFARDVHGNFRALIKPKYQMPREVVRDVSTAQLAFLRTRIEMFRRRVRQGRIVEGHGDLRPEHICVGARPVMIDCLEFNRAFRLVDPLEELGFLAMECEFLGAPRLGLPLVEAYSEVTRDPAPLALIDFYKAYRACLRAKLSLWHIADPAASDSERWRDKALRYLCLAEIYARTLNERIKITRAAS